MDENSEQALEGQLILANNPKKAAPRPRKFFLTSARAVRRELAAVYARLDRGDIDEDNAKARVVVLRAITESLRLDEIEKRLTSLESSTP